MNGSLFQQIIAQGVTELETEKLAPRQWQVLHHVNMTFDSLLSPIVVSVVSIGSPTNLVFSVAIQPAKATITAEVMMLLVSMRTALYNHSGC